MNHVKKSLVSVFFVLSFLSLKSQTFDLTNQRTCSVEDDSVINSDTLLLDVTKNIPTNTYTGLLIPEFISEELSTKLETLIQDLTQKEIIQ